ncbi:MAG: hypothetical protein GY765_41215 [bacterium]|nr:hypothetical protein [bacterium]
MTPSLYEIKSTGTPQIITASIEHIWNICRYDNISGDGQIKAEKGRQARKGMMFPSFVLSHITILTLKFCAGILFCIAGMTPSDFTLDTLNQAILGIQFRIENEGAIMLKLNNVFLGRIPGM